MAEMISGGDSEDYGDGNYGGGSDDGGFADNDGDDGVGRGWW